jgi:hypothetical protein
MMALSFGKRGIYYDPIKLCNHTFHNAFRPITIQDENELFNTIRNLGANESNEIFPVITTSEMSRRLRERLN